MVGVETFCEMAFTLEWLTFDELSFDCPREGSLRFIKERCKTLGYCSNCVDSKHGAWRVWDTVRLIVQPKAEE